MSHIRVEWIHERGRTPNAGVTPSAAVQDAARHVAGALAGRLTSTQSPHVALHCLRCMRYFVENGLLPPLKQPHSVYYQTAAFWAFVDDLRTGQSAALRMAQKFSAPEDAYHGMAFVDKVRAEGTEIAAMILEHIQVARHGGNGPMGELVTGLVDVVRGTVAESVGTSGQVRPRAPGGGTNGPQYRFEQRHTGAGGGRRRRGPGAFEVGGFKTDLVVSTKGPTHGPANAADVLTSVTDHPKDDGAAQDTGDEGIYPIDGAEQGDDVEESETVDATSTVSDTYQEGLSPMFVASESGLDTSDKGVVTPSPARPTGYRCPIVDVQRALWATILDQVTGATVHPSHRVHKNEVGTKALQRVLAVVARVAGKGVGGAAASVAVVVHDGELEAFFEAIADASSAGEEGAMSAMMAIVIVMCALCGHVIGGAIGKDVWEGRGDDGVEDLIKPMIGSDAATKDGALEDGTSCDVEDDDNDGDGDGEFVISVPEQIGAEWYATGGIAFFRVLMLVQRTIVDGDGETLMTCHHGAKSVRELVDVLDKGERLNVGDALCLVIHVVSRSFAQPHKGDTKWLAALLRDVATMVGAAEYVSFPEPPEAAASVEEPAVVPIADASCGGALFAGLSVVERVEHQMSPVKVSGRPEQVKLADANDDLADEGTSAHGTPSGRRVVFRRKDGVHAGDALPGPRDDGTNEASAGDTCAKNPVDLLDISATNAGNQSLLQGGTPFQAAVELPKTDATASSGAHVDLLGSIGNTEIGVQTRTGHVDLLACQAASSTPVPPSVGAL